MQNLIKPERISRKVAVNRTRSAEEAILAVGTDYVSQYRNLPSMLSIGGEEVEVTFFRLAKYLSEGVAEQYALLGLRPADVFEISAAYETDAELLRSYPGFTICTDVNGRLYCCYFSRFGKETTALLDTFSDGYEPYWWLVGVAI